jgi:SAM-dependent methyltransferase
MPAFLRGLFGPEADRSGELMLDADWYHTIELKPGVYTPGKSYSNIALTRRILRGCAVENAVCLDVGAMDGLVSALLCRRGAHRVIACDRYDRRAHIDTVIRALRVKVDYLSSMSLVDVRRAVPRLIGSPFDLIVFSGVLYHMYDPMNGLALVRSLVRQGGLVVIETQAVLSEKMVGYFNAGGQLANDCHNYWNLSVGLLDYLLRYFKLKPLDCLYSEIDGRTAEDSANVLRVCIPCEATAAGIPDPGDAFMVVPGRDDDADYPEWPSEAHAPLSYTPSIRDLILRESGTVDLYQTILNTPPTVWDEDEVRLPLGARF